MPMAIATATTNSTTESLLVGLGGTLQIDDVTDQNPALN